MDNNKNKCSAFRWIRSCVVLGVLVSSPAFAEDLPRSLHAALEEVYAEEASPSDLGVLRRYSRSDRVEERATARAGLARSLRRQRYFDTAWGWVEEYASPAEHHLTWPVVQAFIEAARIQAARGRMFDAVKRLTEARKQADGLSGVMIRRALSMLSEDQPDLEKALAYEREALQFGSEYFVRKKISDTAGHEAAKPGADLWGDWRPEIENRIAQLQRDIDIDRYGLDFVLYREAQRIRQAEHPAASDFTRVDAIYPRMPGSSGGYENRDADEQLSRDLYLSIVEQFGEGVYVDAARLYAAVCLARVGAVNEARAELLRFYRDDPEGLYRGEALKTLGDLYLEAKWDPRNAGEAYSKANRWCETMRTRGRILDTYAVPEASQAVSDPPKAPRRLTGDGRIRESDIPAEALVNRVTADWYLSDLQAQILFRLGFLKVAGEDWDAAFEYFDRALQLDPVLKSAETGSFFNTYDRLRRSRLQQALIATPEEMRGLQGKAKLAMQWADMLFVMAEFDRARSLYQRLQAGAEKHRDGNVFTRAVLGEALLMGATSHVDRKKLLPVYHRIAEEYPRTPSTPYILFQCALFAPITRQYGEPPTARDYFRKVYTRYPGSRMAEKARVEEIVRCLHGSQHAKRKAWIESFEQDFPNSASVTYLRDFDQSILTFYEENRELVEKANSNLKTNYFE